MRWSHLVAPGAPVLDVACGSGRHMRWFAERGHPATGHSVKDLRYHSIVFSFFTPEALHYYLPAFLAAVIDDEREADILWDCVLYALDPEVTWQEYRVADRFNEAQRSAVLAWLKYCHSQRHEDRKVEDLILGFARDSNEI